MTKLAKCLTALGLFLVLIFLLAYFLFVEPYLEAETAMPEDTAFTITHETDGTLLLTWQGADGADSYLLEILDSDGGVLYSSRFVETGCELPSIEDGGDVTIRVTPERDYKTVLFSQTRIGSRSAEITLSLDTPAVSAPTYHIDLDTKTLTFNWTAVDGDTYYVYYTVDDGELIELDTVSDGTCSIAFSVGGDIAVPKLEETLTFYFRAERITDEYSFYGRTYKSISLVRDDLLGTTLGLECTDNGQNFYTLSWGETKGNYYEVQQKTSSSGQWETIAQYGIYDELSFDTGHLKPFTTYYLRVVAYGDETVGDTEFSAYPEEVTITTAESTMYSTVWPLCSLDIYSSEDMTEVIGTASAGTAYCVVGESEGLFEIYTEDGNGFIDSDYCMINLPDYIGSLVSYDITNSYSSIYMIHDYGIPEITGTVIVGYEEVLTDTGYLVPLLYPTAQKLVSAALAVSEDGMRLKIYDSFRPYVATRFLYDQTESILYDTIPDDIFANMTEIPWLTDDEEDGDSSSASDSLDTEDTGETADSEDAPDDETGEDADTYAEERETYYEVMTNGTYSLGAFLARSGSMHNLGIAVDLTLENATTRAELEMQTAMHDLSWNAVVSKNNDSANMLAEYMTDAGFGTLSSEWWHFQDNEIKSTLSLTSLTGGVSVEGWKVDDTGVRYRLADGSYYSDGTYTIGGVKYTFDYYGYVEE